MSKGIKMTAQFAALAAALGLLAGCATTDTGALATQVDEAKQQASQALDAANDAKAKAEAAMNAANEAKQMAGNAEGIAKAAQFTAESTAKRQEQMFKKSMYK